MDSNKAQIPFLKNPLKNSSAQELTCKSTFKVTKIWIITSRRSYACTFFLVSFTYEYVNCL